MVNELRLEVGIDIDKGVGLMGVTGVIVVVLGVVDDVAAANSFSIFPISIRTASSSGSGMRIVLSSLRIDSASAAHEFSGRVFFSSAASSSIDAEPGYSTRRMEEVACVWLEGFLASLLGFCGRNAGSIDRDTFSCSLKVFDLSLGEG